MKNIALLRIPILLGLLLMYLPLYELIQISETSYTLYCLVRTSNILLVSVFLS